MTALAEKQLKSKADEFKSDNVELEKNFKHLQETCARDISESAEKCYDAFNDLQMVIAKIGDAVSKKKYQTICYRSTYNFLVFIENKADPDFFIFLINNAKPFSKLVEHYYKYCSKIETELNMELDSEKSIRSDAELLSKIKSYLKK